MNRPCEDKLQRSFYQGPALKVAREMLGKCLVHRLPEGTTSGIIVETEAYGGVIDPASHSYKGRRTARNQVLWGPAGHAYIYQIYGMYLCLNVVVASEGVPEGVFIRALEPMEGVELMARRRGLDAMGQQNLKKLANGPSKLCLAMEITKAMNGMDLSGDELFLTEGVAAGEIATGPRIGIDYAGEGRSWPWRFTITGNDYVSRPQPSGRRRR